MQTWTSFQINHLGAKPPQWGLPNPHNFSKPSRDICVTAGDGGQRGDVGGDVEGVNEVMLVKMVKTMDQR